MSRFGSATRLSSWAGVCPGNNESAGKQRRGHMRKGNRYLRRVLVQCAWAARKTPTYLGRTFRRLEARRQGARTARLPGELSQGSLGSSPRPPYMRHDRSGPQDSVEARSCQ
jgi:hypothetical protein